MTLLGKGRIKIISCRPYITERSDDILGREKNTAEKTEGNKNMKWIIVLKNGGEGAVLI
jgi:hypothetical protein